MSLVWNSALGLLLVTGGLLGLTLPLGKIGAANGVEPLVWAFLISAGAGVILAFAMLARRDSFKLTGGKIRYFLIAGTISYAVPNVLVFLSLPRLGAGFTGIMFTLSPIVTLLLSVLFRMRRPGMLGVAGIATGFAGALIVASTRGTLDAPAGLGALLLGFCIPLMLAAGNIYRTLDWPADAGPLELAVGSHLAAALVLLMAGLTPLAGFDLSRLSAVPLPAIVQALSSAGMFVFFFRLQAVGGPVYLSQIGYVAAAIGLLSGTLFLGEVYSLTTWAGALVIGLGVAMTTAAQTARAA